MFYWAMASDPWKGMQTKVDAPHEDEGTGESEYREIDLCRFLAGIGDGRLPTAPRGIVYQCHELYVRVDEEELAWVAGRLIDLIGRHTGGVAISVTLASATRARCEFFEARTPPHQRDLGRSGAAEPQESGKSAIPNAQFSSSYGFADLARIEQIVSVHGGEITFNFTGARGLMVTLDLPVAQVRREI